MANEQGHGDKAEPKLILRGVQRRGDTDTFDTTVLLFEGKGEYLQGYVVTNGKKRDVIAHINESKPDPETGEIKPNHLRLSERVGTGDEKTWNDVGYGIAMNSRKDGKPVFFDTVLFNVGDETLNARVTKHVTPEMHEKLGFTSPRAARPRAESSAKVEQAEEPAPEQQPAARRPARPAARKAA